MSKNILYFISMGSFDAKTLKALQRGCPNTWKFIPVSDVSGLDYIYMILTDPSAVKNVQKSIKKILTESELDLVIVSLNYHPLVYQVVQEANKLNIPTLTIIPELICKDLDTFLSPKKFFSEKGWETVNRLNLSSSCPNSNYSICWSLLQKNLLIKRGLPSESIFICGHPVLDRYKRIVNSVSDKSPLVAYTNTLEEVVDKLKCSDKKIISFFMEGEHTTVERLKNILNILIKLIEKRSDIFLYIKIDSALIYDTMEQEDINLLKDLQKEKTDNIYIDGFSDELIDEFDAIYYSKLNIFGVSDKLLGSVLLQKNTLLIEGDLNNSFDFKNKSGLPILEDTLEEEKVIELIENLIETKVSFTPEQINYYLINFLPCIYDGNNSLRVQKVIDFVMNLTTEMKQTKENLLKSFLEKNPNLQDPLYHQKQNAEKALEDI